MYRYALLVATLVAICAAGGRAETVYSDGWVPPRLVDGVWVTSGVSDEVAKEEAAIVNQGKTRDEVRQGEWDVYWQWHWQDADAPQWAVSRGEEEAAAEEAAQRREEKRQNALAWQQYYASQTSWGLPEYYYSPGLPQYHYSPRGRSDWAQRRFYDLIDDPWATPGEIGHAMLDALDEIGGPGSRKPDWAQRRFYDVIDDPWATPGEIGNAMLDALDEIDSW